MVYRLLLVFCCSLTMLSAADKVRLSDVVKMPDRPRPFYKVYMIGQDPLICDEYEENKEEGKITFTLAGTKVEQTQTNNRLERVEPKITPAELVVGRGKEILAAHKYEHLHTDAQRELLRLMHWATDNETVNFGKDEVPAPVAEAMELSISAARQYPKNFEILDLMHKLLSDNDYTDLEKVLIERLKEAPRWDKGYAGIAKILDTEGREQDLLGFVRGWVDRLPASQEANKWAVRIAIRNNDTNLAKESSRRLWLRNKDPKAGAEYATILLFENKAKESLAIAREVMELNPEMEEMKIIAGSALLSLNQLEEANSLLNQASNSPNPKLQAMAKHNIGVLNWLRGESRKARQAWADGTHPATKLARAIANKKQVKDREVLNHPALAMTAGELNAALALEEEAPAKALTYLTANRSDRHTFLKQVAELIQSNYGKDATLSLNFYNNEESILWRAYAYIQKGDFAKAEALLQDLPSDHGYASVYRVYCAEGLGDAPRASKLFEIAQTSKNPPADYVSELESYYLSMKSSKELEQFKWAAGDRLKTGWFSEAKKTGIHVFASGEYLAFSGVQKEASVSRAWRKRSKERLRKISAKFDPAQGWSGLELLDEKGENGIAIAIERIDDEKQYVWRRLSDGKWAKVWNPLSKADKNQIILLLDDGLVGNEQIQLQDSKGQMFPLGSISDIPGSSMRVGFFTVAPRDTEIDFKVRELLFEVRPKDEE